MGCYRHRFDGISFSQEGVLEPIASRIQEFEESTQHSVFLFGVKSTSCYKVESNKKYLMSKLVVRLKDFLVGKLETGEEIEAVYLKRSQEEEKNLTMRATD